MILIKKQLKLCMICIALTLLITGLSATSVSAVTERANNNMRVASGTGHSLLIDQDGNVWAFGNNSNKQIGDGTTIFRASPVMVYSKNWKGRAISVAAGAKQSLALLDDGTVLQWGFGKSVQDSLQNPILTGASAVAAGQNMGMAILKTGTAVCWSEDYRQLPVKKDSGGDLTGVKEIAVGSDTFLIARTDSDGGVYQLKFDNDNDCWIAARVILNTSSPTPTSGGYPTPTSGGYPTPSSPGSSSISSSSALASHLVSAVSISAGTNYGLALLSSGDVYSWAKDNTNNIALGQGTAYLIGYNLARKINTISDGTKISAGLEHAMAINASGSVFGWGKATNKRLDGTTSSATKYTPIPLSIAITGINQLDCGNLSNIALGNDGEFYSWGDSMDLTKLILKQSLLKNPAPAVTASMVGDQSMTLTWTPDDYYIEMATGFMITYTMPDGTEGKTQLLPLTQTQITLRGLQAATNYNINFRVIGKTGFEDMVPSFVVQTAKDDGISPSPEPSPTPDLNKASSEFSSSSSSSSNDKGVGKLSSLFNLILIILVLLVLAAAVIAIVYVWKRLDKNELQKIKSVRVSADPIRLNNAAETDGNPMNTSDKTPVVPEELRGRVILSGDSQYMEADDMDMKIVTDKGVSASYPVKETPVNPSMDPGIRTISSPASYESTLDGQDSDFQDEQTQFESDDSIEYEESETLDKPEDITSNKALHDDTDDEFLTRLPQTGRYEEEDDDFIIRKPGEPKK